MSPARSPSPPPGDLRRADAATRRRTARRVLDAQADLLERTVLTRGEVAQVLTELAAEWSRDAVAGIVQPIGLMPDTTA